jgi:pyruvate,water dikinase
MNYGVACVLTAVGGGGENGLTVKSPAERRRRDRAVRERRTVNGPATAAARTVEFLRPFERLRKSDVGFAGGKGANLGELKAAGVRVPDGFVVGAQAYRAYCAETGLQERLEELLKGVDVEDTAALHKAAEAARALFDATPVGGPLAAAVTAAYEGLAGAGSERREAADGGAGAGPVPVAVRSSATAEDTAQTSFAGMNETFLNTRGAAEVLDAVRRCWRSGFGARTIYYRAVNGMGPTEVAIAVVVQRQIESTRAGVMFTVNPATGERGEIVIEGSFGLGEAVVSGAVSPDRYVVEKGTKAVRRREVHRKELAIEYAPDGGTRQRTLTEEESLRPVLTDEEVKAVATEGERIEEHYGEPQDTEWAFDGDGTLWMLQSRPITTLHDGAGETPGQDRPGEGAAEGPTEGAVLLRGLGGAPGSASGTARVLGSIADAAKLRDGDVLVTHMTAPDWLPVMRRAAAIVTDSGGMTCHAAIVSRELGIPCVVGTGEATKLLRDGEAITVDATRGVVREGVDFLDLDGGWEGPPATEGSGPRAAARPTGGPEEAPSTGAGSAAAGAPVTGTRILVNLSEPSQVERVKGLAVDGVGLLRAEMMVLEALGGSHPRTLIEEGKAEEFVAQMADGLSTFAEGFAPRPVTYRTIDFRTNEFRGLRGGDRFEPEEANPMIGYRGALRYTREPEVFALEMEAVKRVWDAGRRNLHVMLPFVRTARELKRCRELIAATGLTERRGFELWVMAEVPSVLFNLAAYKALGIAGISIGSNDLTQLLLGADRDNEVLAETFDERDPAVVAYLHELIPRAKELGLKTSICGQAPSVHEEYAEILVRAGIDAISVSVDAVDRTRALTAAAERRVLLDAARGTGRGGGGSRGRARRARAED